MSKKIRKLTESNLHKIVSECVKKILQENNMSKDNFELFLDILDECGWSYFNYNKVHGKDKLGRNRTGERFLLDKKNLNACDNSVLIEKLKNTFNDDIVISKAYHKYGPEISYNSVILLDKIEEE
jgi:hypothetical protein